jgi:surfeit locus 1 family protein
LLTPLILENGQAVLVQRGWLPSKFDSPTSWREFDESNPAFIEGILRLPMTEGQMGGGVPDPTLEPGKRSDFWNFVNIEQIQKQIPYPLLGIYIQQSPDADKTSLPYPSLPELDLSNGTHLGYALQWFFFAGLLLIGYIVYIKMQSDKRSN